MWGTNDLKRRIDNVEKVAAEARDVGNRALTEIATHAGACAVLQKTTQEKLNDLKESNTWQLRGIVTTLLMVVGAIIFELLKRFLP